MGSYLGIQLGTIPQEGRKGEESGLRSRSDEAIGDLVQGWSFKVVLYYDKGNGLLCLHVDQSLDASYSKKEACLWAISS